MSDNRLIYIGTVDGLYRAEKNGHGYATEPLGLQGKGGLRCPVVTDWKDAACLYAATNKAGVFRSRDGGDTWHEINEGITYKEVWSLVQHPQTGELYAGTGPSSVFKSTDGGDTWTDCEQIRTLPETKNWTFPGPPYVSHVKGLALCKDDPSLILGGIEEGWVIRSQDGGKTWQNIKEGLYEDVHSVTYMPDNPGVVIATTGRGVFRSTHSADYFEESNEGLDRRYAAQLVVHPKRPRVLFTAAAAVPPPAWRRAEGADSGFYRSEDQGVTWQRLTGGLPDHIAGAPRATAGDPEDANAVLVGLTDGSVWMSENGGESFETIIQGLPSIGSLAVVRH